jgi:hypothetical protein
VTSIHRSRAAKPGMQAEPGRDRSVVLAPRNAHAWHLYHVLRQKNVQALADDVDSVSGKVFASAHEPTVDEVWARDPG